MASDLKIIVAGAGAIGCFVGGLLASAGHDVTLLARPQIGQEIRAHGLTLTDFHGMAHKVDADALTLSERPNCFADADIILVTVRSQDTKVMARMIAAHAPATVKVISLQNEPENVQTLRATLVNYDVRAGVVPFSVAAMGQGCFHRTTVGDIKIGTGPEILTEVFNVPGLSLEEDQNITQHQWGNFLINLNNALNALSGLTLPDQLHDRTWRALMADQWKEALKVLRASNIQPLSTLQIPASAIPATLRLPTPFFARVAASIFDIDPQARMSMSHDLMSGRSTGIDTVQGQVVRMGAKVGVATPISTMVVEVMKLAETAGEGLPHLPVTALRQEIK